MRPSKTLPLLMRTVLSAQLNPEVRLLRVLLRTDCDGVRKSMLQERLQLANHDIFLVSNCGEDEKVARASFFGDFFQIFRFATLGVGNFTQATLPASSFGRN